jgi:hypothetical protein
MKLVDWILTIFIIAIIIGFNIYSVFVTMYDDINENWAEHKCSPSVMPFADVFGHDVMSNFYGCVQNTQSSFTKYMLAPVNYGMTMLADIGVNFQESTNSARGFLAWMREAIVGIVEFIFAAFVNILIEFQKLTISLKDLFYKIMGVIVTFLFFVDGSIKSLTSIWKGPVGGAVRTIGKFRLPRIRLPRIRFPRICFDGDNLIELNCGKTIKMSELKPGDILKSSDNNKVIATIELLNDKSNEMYSLNNITVTNGHKVYTDSNKLEYVGDVSDSVSVPNTKKDYVYNFITQNGMLELNGIKFSDWHENSEHETKCLLNVIENKLSSHSDSFHYFFYNNLLNKDLDIKLNDETSKEVKDLIPGDILENNVKVVGVVKMFFESWNNYKYHIITDEGIIPLEGLVIGDFDTIIDKYLNIL